MRFQVRTAHLFQALTVFVCCLLLQPQPTSASPFGHGQFGADVPFGSETSLTIALGSDVNFTLGSSGANFVGNGSHTITVTSTDVVGYSLYAYSTSSTDLTSDGGTIPASTNLTAAPLAINSWGYNVDGSNNYIGLTTIPTQILTATGPYKNGNNTLVHYGVFTDNLKPAGHYTAHVTYTAVALNN